MVGDPQRFDLLLDGLSTTKRDALLRHTVTKLINYGIAMGCWSVTVENLNFTDGSAGKDSPTTTKKLRRVVSGIPTRKLRDW